MGDYLPCMSAAIWLNIAGSCQAASCQLLTACFVSCQERAANKAQDYSTSAVLADKQVPLYC